MSQRPAPPGGGSAAGTGQGTDPAYSDWAFATASTRPVIRGRSFMVACGHYLACVAGLRMYALGGNAFDAGVAMVFAQSVLEYQSYGFGGEVPILIHAARDGQVAAISGNTRAAAAATNCDASDDFPVPAAPTIKVLVPFSMPPPSNVSISAMPLASFSMVARGRCSLATRRG